ncbi:MAG: SGNH/GDSL hydrolase family protein [Desulforegulaceae bacterium]|nr:SGNH/GDSL hydrolase family protein [Desulforegulaceae bacterium]
MVNKDLSSGFFGDSIFYGYQTDYESRCFRVFEKQSGIKPVFKGRENPLGFPGAGVFDLIKLSASLFNKYFPDILFLCVGANHFDENGILRYPYSMGEADFFDQYFILFEKLHKMGLNLIWCGFPPFEQGGIEQKRALYLSHKISEIAKKFDFKSSFFIESLINQPDFDPRGGIYYDNLAIDIHPNNCGQEFIGSFYADYIKKNQ